eukprot:1141061-Pelagomonas_calceolata.AAC.8
MEWFWIPNVIGFMMDWFWVPALINVLLCWFGLPAMIDSMMHLSAPGLWRLLLGRLHMACCQRPMPEVHGTH